MKKNLEVLLDTKPNGGCGCNCGCAGSSVVEDIDNLVENLKKHNFSTELEIEVQPISNFDSEALVNKINTLLSTTNAVFRVDQDSLEETLSNMLPLLILDGTILTAYGVPTLHDVISEVEKSL